MAEEFHVGTTGDDGKRDNRYLSAVDVAGIALAAIQELNKRIQKTEQLEAENIEIKAKLREMDTLLQKLRTKP